MAFFDEIGRKLSQTGQTAVQKTKGVADIAKISTYITEEEKMINANYIRIGKLYMSMHAADDEEGFGVMITEIRESENRIRDFRQQIQDIKGVICCEHCGAEISSNSAFCSECGASVSKNKAVADDLDQVRCIGCGQMISQEMKFCTSCGMAVAGSIQAQMSHQESEETVEEMPETVQFQEKSIEKRCPDCGTVIEEDSIFCTGCGKRL